ncbi:helix-turn-helix domain-containing protein [Nonomuraea sp. K274]|uniref:Helix-turn-helix domain-containing protein n=1 Tax=Nonomuraea cypriaca TaxID=1187855 RepID=A0A931F0V2_9ACTN|nr:helix-turn-helix transcriptional regulator [Nonomuraea cypriaca]MBF8189830.1 helix-turn-helix domain-containing protein [Nonomuraea cypriaca]
MHCDNLLGDFLRSRREVTTPAQAGLRYAGPRRTPGLRRDEVAMLAGVSTAYYVRLEQGRERNPSDQVLSSLARALLLDEDAIGYLYTLIHPWSRPRTTPGPAERVSPSVLQLLNSWPHVPALVLGRRLDVLATNPLIEAVYEGQTHLDNCLRMIYLSPAAQDFYPDWEKAAFAKTAQLRVAAARHRDDPYIPRLVEELSAKSAEFRRIWARHDVQNRNTEVKEFRHPVVGELTLSWEVLTVSGTSGQQLIVLTAEPGSASERAVAELARRVARPRERLARSA